MHIDVIPDFPPSVFRCGIADALRFALKGSLACLLAWLAPGYAAGLSPGERPNFILIIGDDISADDIGCYGNPGIRTPNIDRLAANGLLFSNAYVTTSSCSPSRCSIVASRYPHNLGTASELHGPLPPGLPLLPQLLRDDGYYCAQAGKIHFGNGSGGPVVAGFHVTGRLADDPGGEAEWIDRLRQRPKDRPFFMWFAALDAHRPWDAGSFSGMNRPEDVRVPPYLVDTPDTRQDLAHYYDEITRLDYYVGEVMAELRRQKVDENTILIFMTDNGRPFPRSKTHLYDDGVKTPFVVHWPRGIPRAATVDGLLSAIDIGPTFLELAGIRSPETFQGVSFVPMLRDPSARVRDYVFAEKNWHNFTAHMRMVRLGSFVYIRNAWPELPQPGASDTFYNPSADALKALHAQGSLTVAQANVFQQPRSSEEFYDLRADPEQIHNIIHDRFSQPAIDKLRAAMDRWVKETGDSVSLNPTKSNVDYITGYREGQVLRGTPAGGDANATRVNAPGPVLDQ